MVITMRVYEDKGQKPCVLLMREWEGMSQCVQLCLAARTRVEGKLLDNEASRCSKRALAVRIWDRQNSCVILVIDYFCLS